LLIAKVTGLLNKLTFEHFDSITEQIADVGIDTAELLAIVIGISLLLLLLADQHHLTH
jgi:hypothetical protein